MSLPVYTYMPVVPIMNGACVPNVTVMFWFCIAHFCSAAIQDIFTAQPVSNQQFPLSQIVCGSTY